MNIENGLVNKEEHEIEEKKESNNPKTFWLLILAMVIGVGVLFSFLDDQGDNTIVTEPDNEMVVSEAVFKDVTVGDQNTLFLTMQEEIPGEFYEQTQVFELHLKKAKWAHSDSEVIKEIILENSNFDVVDQEKTYTVGVELVSETIMKLTVDIRGDASAPCSIQVPVNFEATHLGEATVELVPLESAISQDVFVMAEVTKK